MRKSLFVLSVTGFLSFSMPAFSWDSWGHGWLPIGTPFPGFYTPTAPGAVPNRALSNMCLDGYNYDNAAARRLCSRSGYPMPGEFPYYPGLGFPTPGSRRFLDPTDPAYPTDRRSHRG